MAFTIKKLHSERKKTSRKLSDRGLLKETDLDERCLLSTKHESIGGLRTITTDETTKVSVLNVWGQTRGSAETP